MRLDLEEEINLHSPEATGVFAARVGSLLVPGDTILLEGPVGAGKSHFARALIQNRLAAAALHDDVPSPTYTLVQTYEDRKTEIWHADLYRLGHVDEVIELGLDEAFSTAIVLVEWPGRLGSLAPEDALTLTITPTGDAARTIRLTAGDAKWARIFNMVSARNG